MVLSKIFFSKHENRIIFALKLNEFKIQDDLKVLSSNFQGLKNFCSLIALSSLCNLTGLNSLYSPISSKNFLIQMVWSSMTWKWPIPVLFCGMNHQKYKFPLISVSFSVGGCWGQNMLLFWKLVDETQIPQSQEYTDTFKQNLTCTFLSIRGNLEYTLCHEGPCNWPTCYFVKMILAKG